MNKNEVIFFREAQEKRIIRNVDSFIELITKKFNLMVEQEDKELELVTLLTALRNKSNTEADEDNKKNQNGQIIQLKEYRNEQEIQRLKQTIEDLRIKITNLENKIKEKKYKHRRQLQDINSKETERTPFERTPLPDSEKKSDGRPKTHEVILIEILKEKIQAIENKIKQKINKIKTLLNSMPGLLKEQQHIKNLLLLSLNLLDEDTNKPSQYRDKYRVLVDSLESLKSANETNYKNVADQTLKRIKDAKPEFLRLDELFLLKKELSDLIKL
ncbi:MAG: hypothetical protein GF332_02255 [Candidatus Moranbacteria bacterium]|nr:hypothetical protein [Candidatus Moranbacteria bacterium]